MAITSTGTRAREPDQRGFAQAPDGLRLAYEVFGAGSPPLVLLPSNPIAHSRMWKAQVPYLARRNRVVTYDGRGNGDSDHPDPDALWRASWRRDDCLAVMDATGTHAAVLVGLCSDGIWPAIELAAEHPERVLGLVAVNAGLPAVTPPYPFRGWPTFDEPRPDEEGWNKECRAFVTKDLRGYLEFFFGQMFPEPHSTKQIEDLVAYGLDGRLETLVADEEDGPGREEVEAACRRLRCPVLVIQGDLDQCQPFERGTILAELTGAERIVLEGCGHLPTGRAPVVVNHAIRDFVDRLTPPEPRLRAWTRPAERRPRVLLVSSPIGLGHAWRDVAVARELRALVPGLRVEWLAQEPLTRVLERCGEHVHPASAELAPEAAHIDAESGEHALHAFEALRRLDEIFCANFMLFADVAAEERYDAWIADEAWELDYFLHENPELKTAPFAWLTDFVGYVPMPEGGEREAALTADLNAEMLEQRARFPWIRDRSLFVGDPGDVVDRSFGDGLPGIRAWTAAHFRFTGYAMPDPPPGDRAALRAELGFAPDERVCVVSAGGSAVGEALLRRVIEAVPEARERVGDLRTIVVTGPRIDPAALGAGDGVEVHGYVHDLSRHLAACDLGIVHGGLATTMELTAAGRPFLFFPLRGHFEQNVHVAHRLARHGAGRRMDFDRDGPAEIAAAMADELAGEPRYAPVPRDGARRAATAIAELLRDGSSPHR